MKLQAATRLVTADAEWWTQMPDHLKEEYVKEHPNSKYAQGWQRKGEDEPVEEKPKAEEPPAKEKPRQVSEQDKPGQEQPKQEPKKEQPKKQGKDPADKGPKKTYSEQDLMERIQKGREGTSKRSYNDFKAKMKSLPQAARTMVKNALDNPTGEAIKDTIAEASETVSNVTRRAFKDMKSAAGAGSAALKILSGKTPSKQEAKGLMSTMFNVLAIGGIAATAGVGLGPALLGFAALKYMIAPFLANQIGDAVFDIKHSINHAVKGPGIWTFDGKTYIPFSQEELDNMSDEEFYRIANSNFKKQEASVTKVTASSEQAFQKLMQEFMKFAAQNMNRKSIAHGAMDMA